MATLSEANQVIINQLKQDFDQLSHGKKAFMSLGIKTFLEHYPPPNFAESHQINSEILLLFFQSIIINRVMNESYDCMSAFHHTPLYKALFRLNQSRILVPTYTDLIAASSNPLPLAQGLAKLHDEQLPADDEIAQFIQQFKTVFEHDSLTPIQREEQDTTPSMPIICSSSSLGFFADASAENVACASVVVSRSVP